MLIILLWINSGILHSLSRAFAIPSQDTASYGPTQTAFCWRRCRRDTRKRKKTSSAREIKNYSKHLAPSARYQAKRQHSPPSSPPDKENVRSQLKPGAPGESSTHRNVKSFRAFHLGQKKMLAKQRNSNWHQPRGGQCFCWALYPPPSRAKLNSTTSGHWAEAQSDQEEFSLNGVIQRRHKIRLCLLEAGRSLGNWPGYLALHSHYQQVILAPYPLPGEE